MAKKIDKRLLMPEKKSTRPLTEAEEWAKHGCSNNEEWHAYLKQTIEKGYVPDEADGCYIGTAKPLKDTEDFD
jgi:hypothetical protein